MDNKMTSGEIAKKAGISQKAIRLYDEKGLLKPSDYSKGNYRLYDNEALLVLEKIIALKQVGLSLEEIKEHLLQDDNNNVIEVLKQQLQMLEQKKYEVEKSIACIKNAITRSGSKTDWDLVADVICTIQKDQRADENHMYALKHTDPNEDWYVKIYNTLDITEGANILDLGCGFGKLWRNNWDNIPENTKVYGYDLHGSWAEDFSQYVNEHSGRLAKGTDIQVRWGDVETVETWENIGEGQTYSLVIAHYLKSFLKDFDELYRRVATVLSKDGMFSITGNDSVSKHICLKDIFEKIGINTRGIDERIRNNRLKQDELEIILKKYFSKVETIAIPNNLIYDNAQEIFEMICKIYSEQNKMIMNNKDKIIQYFEEIIAAEGQFILINETEFVHCYK